MKRSDYRTVVSLPGDWKGKLQDECSKRNMTVSSLIRELIRKHFNLPCCECGTVNCEVDK